MSTARFCLVLKLASGKWLTRKELAAAAGTRRNNIEQLVADLVEEGLLVERTREKNRPVGGLAPAEVTVSRAWGGPADV
jgi:biotin operon repressor